MRIEAAKWQGDRPPPTHIFLKARVALWLPVTFFSFDTLLQNSLSIYGGFCKRVSVYICRFFTKQTAPIENRKSLQFAGKWPRCRGPPSWKSESYPSALIFRFSEVALCTTENFFGFFSETFLTRSKTARVILYHYSRA